MKVGLIAENIGEWIALKLGLAPKPLFETMSTVLLARSITTATKVGVFEALESGSLSASEVVERCKADTIAMTKLLNSLVGSGYLRFHNNYYDLTAITRKWLLKSSTKSLYDEMMFRTLAFPWIEQLETYIRNGATVKIHSGSLSTEEWNLYQKGMRSVANMRASLVGEYTPVPKGAKEMLDIGGSHGYYSAEICRRNPGLKSVILDLPEAVEHAAPILAQEGMSDRITYRAGDALTDDLGKDAYDVVYIANLMHHFSETENRRLVKRVANALRPGGAMVIDEIISSKSPNDGDQIGKLIDLYFGLTSDSGLWTLEEMADWQKEAGLTPIKPGFFAKMKRITLQVGVKPR
jgi:2-polyprenyl-3-methyl-5-hydroxy-6-metoxy-1,4-benzoquinol methylase